ncbi:MAG: hypothetical protein HKN28_05230 [Alphaproteobacteria bacterium]|nr:hypothetical protein [Alphaproteobacteria bacterium]
MDEQKRESYLSRSAVVIEQVQQCIASGLEGVSTEELEYFLNVLIRMNEAVKTGNMPPSERRYRELTGLIMDHWPWDNPIVNSITGLEEMYCNL